MSNYDWYIKNVYKPAQDWYKNGGADWVKKYIANSTWIIDNYDLINLGVYKIILNDKVAYVGEAVKVSNRFIVHAWNLAMDSKLKFGVLPEEIKNEVIRINMICIESGIHSNSKREQKEIEYVKRLKPFLQKNDMNDTGRKDMCIPSDERRDATCSNLALI